MSTILNHQLESKGCFFQFQDDMLEIKTEIISDGEDDEEEDDDDDVGEGEESHPDSFPDSHPVSLPAVVSNVSYIIAHGPNGLISIPRR